MPDRDLHLLILLPKWLPEGLGQDRSQEPGASSGLSIGVGAQALGPVSTAFSGALAENWTGKGGAETQNPPPKGMLTLQVVALPDPL